MMIKLHHISLSKAAYTAAALAALESLDLLLAKLSLRRSLCSFNLEARSFWYSAASDLALAILFFLSAILARFRWSVRGVTSLCILGALLTFFPVIKRSNTIKTTIHHKECLCLYILPSVPKEP